MLVLVLTQSCDEGLSSAKGVLMAVRDIFTTGTTVGCKLGAVRTEVKQVLRILGVGARPSF